MYRCSSVDAKSGKRTLNGMRLRKSFSACCDKMHNKLRKEHNALACFDLIHYLSFQKQLRAHVCYYLSCEKSVPPSLKSTISDRDSRLNVKKISFENQRGYIVEVLMKTRQLSQQVYLCYYQWSVIVGRVPRTCQWRYRWESRGSRCFSERRFGLKS